jgi:hypothetical protein
MSSSSRRVPSLANADSGARQGVHRLYERVQGVLKVRPTPSTLSDSEIQDLLALACKLYAERRQEQAELDAFGPLQDDAGITATDGAITASALLDAVSVEVFELGMWRTWGTAG